MDFHKSIKEKQNFIDAALEKYLPIGETPQSNIFEAMRYSVFAGGKRLRPILMISACDFVNGDRNSVIPFACALEMIHTYSLIHDDLPAMDNDDYRRGKLTNHKVYGEGIAVLAGDALLNYAYELMIEFIMKGSSHYKDRISAMYEIARASGVYGMIGGQVVDINSEKKQIDGSVLDFIHNNKTGALFVASIRVGAILGGANRDELENLTTYAHNIGLGFQITDDILDIICDDKKLLKKTGSDQAKQKATYPAIHGLDASIEKVNQLFEQGLGSILHYGEKATFFKDMAYYLMKREY
ncbi:MAG: polyprenyl synthetase family protein [Thermotaleaceae bacterium]